MLNFFTNIIWINGELYLVFTMMVLPNSRSLKADLMYKQHNCNTHRAHFQKLKENFTPSQYHHLSVSLYVWSDGISRISPPPLLSPIIYPLPLFLPFFSSSAAPPCPGSHSSSAPSIFLCQLIKLDLSHRAKRKLNPEL